MDQKNTWHFFLNKNLVFIDSMQFMNSSLDKLVKNLSDGDFRYLVEDLMKKFNYLLENIYLVQQKKERLIMMVEYQMVT